MRIKHADLDELIHMVRLSEHLIGASSYRAFTEMMVSTEPTAVPGVYANYKERIAKDVNRMEAPALGKIITWGMAHNAQDEMTREGAKYVIAYSGLHFIQCTSIHDVYLGDMPCTEGGIELLRHLAIIVLIAFIYDLARQNLYVEKLRKEFKLKTKVEPVGRYLKKK